MTWKVDVHSWITDSEDNIICTVVNKENMPVIAAAKEMYGALEELVGIVHDIIDGGDYVPDSFTLQPAENALYKAGWEGE